ncbi:variable surface protein Vir12-like [Plasmodium vivax]|uniref:Variable surface protein Vir12-like n=1 Tax=Plasmodium vivax (strain Salvador I) TaxID=126793 RepID=A5K734_PLAVS|nr:variable surface protein Vir12-like [Plasmodium vivax]EDL44593.1 variable surface protein Vir12-like [Plasmodium vivax]|eukprot:XP_001614320.1 variable surface protein Vir12-like [Plasmodium vivax Sal-1]
MGDYSVELWDKVLEDTPLYKKLSDNVSKPSVITDECKTLKITGKKISNELCNKFAKNLQHVYSIADKTEHDNTCDNYKYWIFNQMWKLIGSKKNDPLAKEVIEDFLNIQTSISKKQGKTTCQYHFNYKDYEEFEENLEKMNLKHYFKNYETIKKNASSKDKYDVYHKYVPYIIKLFDKHYEDCGNTVDYYFNDCEPFFEKESDKFNPKDLLPLLEKAKPQAAAAKTKETGAAVQNKGQELNTPGGGDGVHSKGEKLSAGTENPGAGGLEGKDKASRQQASSAVGTGPSDVKVQVKKPEEAPRSPFSFNPFSFWSSSVSSTQQKSANLVAGQGQKAPKELVPPAKGKAGETADPPLKSAPAPKVTGTGKELTTATKLPEAESGRPNPEAAKPVAAKPVATKSAAPEPAREPPVGVKPAAAKHVVVKTEPAVSEPENRRREVSETSGTLHNEAPLSSLPVGGAEQGVHVAQVYNPELASSEVPLAVADTPSAVGTTHEELDSNFFRNIIMAVAVLGTICFLFYYNRSSRLESSLRKKKKKKGKIFEHNYYEEYEKELEMYGSEETFLDSESDRLYLNYHPDQDSYY